MLHPSSIATIAASATPAAASARVIQLKNASESIITSFS
jgi:hypothetical protein